MIYWTMGGRYYLLISEGRSSAKERSQKEMDIRVNKRIAGEGYDGLRGRLMRLYTPTSPRSAWTSREDIVEESCSWP